MSALFARLRPLALPAFVTLIGVVVLISLGLWQLDRRHWKEDLLVRIQSRMHAPPGPIVPEGEWPAWNATAGEYRHVRLDGTFLHDKAVFVHGNAPRDERGDVLAGFFVLTPLRLEDGAQMDGAMVIVNRGFVPYEWRDPAHPGLDRPDGRVSLTGLARAAAKGAWFLPGNDPLRDEWFSRDVGEIAAARGLRRVAPFIVDADASASGGRWPRGGLTVVNFPNNHFEYALIWFGLAAALLSVFAVWSRPHWTNSAG